MMDQGLRVEVIVEAWKRKMFDEDDDECGDAWWLWWMHVKAMADAWRLW